MDGTEKQPTLSIEGFDPIWVLRYAILGNMGLLISGNSKQVLGRLIKQSFHLRYKATGELVFFGFTVILPPKSATRVTEQSVLHALSQAFLDLTGEEVSDERLTQLKKAIDVLHAPSLETADIAAEVRKVGAKRFIFIAEAEKYRAKDVHLPAVFGISAVRSTEDIWIRHVASLGTTLSPIVKATDIYIFIHVTEPPLHKDESLKLLENIDWNIWQAEHMDDSPETIVNKNVQNWVNLALTGSISVVRDEISSLALDEITKKHLLAQLLGRAGKEEELLSVIDEILSDASSLAASQRVQLAALAINANSFTQASNLLATGIEELVGEEWFEKALDLALQLGSDELITKFDNQMSSILPNSQILRDNRDRRLLLNCRSIQNKEFQFPTTGFTDKHAALWRALNGESIEYDKINDLALKWDTEWQELALLCCAAHAQSVGRHREAVRLATSLTISDLYGRQATQILLSCIRTLMLMQEVTYSESDYYREPLAAVIRYLAKYPQDEKTRTSVISLLTVEACGDIAMPIAALLALDMASEGVILKEQQTANVKSGGARDTSDLSTSDNSDSDISFNDPQFKQVVQSGLLWLHQHKVVEYGVTRLPVELVGNDPDGVVKNLVSLLYLNGSHGPQDTDLVFLDQMVLLTSAIAPYATVHRNGDLSALRLLACQNVLCGSAQHARNLCEQMLIMGQDSHLRKRLAWAAFADVYHRCRKPVGAFVGIACAMATNSEVSAADLWQEIHTLIRVLRDLGMIKYAKDLMPTLKKLMEQIGIDPENDRRVTTLDLSIRLFEVRDNDAVALSRLVEDMASNCEAVMDDPSNLVPAVTILAQTVLKCDSVPVPVNKHCREILSIALTRIGARLSQFVATVSSISPTPDHVVEMYNKVQRAITSEDAPADLIPVTVSARRLLGGAQEQSPEPEICALAVEILAEQGVKLLGDVPALSTSWPLTYAKELSLSGLEIVFLALNSQNELLVTHVMQGTANLIEQPKSDRSFLKRMQVWLNDYPRAYGFIEAHDGIDEFYTSMEMLGVKFSSEGQLLIVAEPMLQQITMNLIVVEPQDGGFSYLLGSKAAIGVTPSLQWLSQARGNARKGRGSYKAWISAEDSSLHGGTLGLVLDRLKDTFDQYNFVVDTGRMLPRDVSDASLVVVCAHGGLTHSGKYIHTISDEDNLVESPSALAQSLRGIELVILFVCSGGRLDKHPFDNSTVGLPKQLLNQGCRTVIASPWPLDAKVTYNWLAPFIQAWEAGETVLSATKKANDAVTLRLGDYPQYGLGMTVYGDVLLSKEI